MSQMLLSLAAALMCTAAADLGSLNHLRVLQPATLAHAIDSPITDLGTALFGKYPFGQSIQGAAVYPRNNTDGCSQYSEAVLVPPGVAPIFVADYSDNCSYQTMVLHAQQAGAIAVIIVDTDPWYKRYMYPNSRGIVSVPSILIEKSKGKMIEQAVHDQKNPGDVRLEMLFDIADKRNEVSIDVIVSSFKFSKMAHFANEFSGVAGMLSKESTAHMNLVFSIVRKNKYFKPEECLGGFCSWYCDENCQEYMQEMLRQMCIFQNNWMDWWRYLPHFFEHCSEQALIGEQCSQKSAAAIGIDFSAVKSCVDEQMNPHGQNFSLFAASADFADGFEWPSNPVFVVNNAPLNHGYMSCPGPLDRSTCDLFNLVCRAHLTTPPFCLAHNTCLGAGEFVDACGSCYGALDERRIDDPSLCDHAAKSSVSYGTSIVIAVVCSSAASGLLLCYFMRKVQENKRLLMDRLSQYVSLDQD